ncbi:hypothetical protein MLD38_039807 [Melastoma candidum]|uniref:Uncharacterized protein n=1 Tax=Melastoma candidum TaxID=119954 RepID=A0ACB9L413_9MYRT|nr:hypothetical protein MLD38_039807 [Melastoma candidum]
MLLWLAADILKPSRPVQKYLFKEVSLADEHSRGHFAETSAVVAGGLVNCSAGLTVLTDVVVAAFITVLLIN